MSPRVPTSDGELREGTREDRLGRPVRCTVLHPVHCELPPEVLSYHLVELVVEGSVEVPEDIISLTRDLGV